MSGDIVLPKTAQKRYDSYLKRHNKYTPFQTPKTPLEFYEDLKKKTAEAVAKSLKKAGPLMNRYRCWKSQNPEQNTMGFEEWKEYRKTLPKDSVGRKYAMHTRHEDVYAKWVLHKFYLIANLGNKDLSLEELVKKTGLSSSGLSHARTLEKLPYGLGRLKKHK
jgi:uncharacterized short protein YbdD (DUF466 family)